MSPDYYHASVAEHVLEFAAVIRGEATSEYTDEDAIMAMMMDVASRESILREGARVKLPLAGRLDAGTHAGRPAPEVRRRSAGPGGDDGHRRAACLRSSMGRPQSEEERCADPIR